MLRMLHDTSGGREDVRMLHETSGRRPMPRMLHETSGREPRFDSPRMLHVSSGRPQFTEERSDAVRVNCDNCRCSIDRLRYKCSTCPNFDFCSKCMDEYEQELMDNRGNPSANQRQRSAHPLNHHVFQRIAFRVTSTSAPAFQNREAWRHQGVKCANCPLSSGDIVGYRYFCTNCAQSYCESCELAGAHRLDHNLLKMVPTHIAEDPQWQRCSGCITVRK